MIFAETYKLILAGKKTCTTRVRHVDDSLLQNGTAIVMISPDITVRVRWKVGQTYAVQPGRGQKAVCRIRFTRFEAVEDRTAITPETATLPPVPRDRRD